MAGDDAVHVGQADAGAFVLVGMAAQLRASLADDGLLLACHWVHPFAEALTPAAQVHRAFARGLEEAFCYQDADMAAGKFQGVIAATTPIG